MRPIALALLAASAFAPQAARDYYQELYKAGGLDRMADQYVCFADDPSNSNFFVFAESVTLERFLRENGGLAKLTKTQQRALAKGFLIIHGYSKGIPFSEEEFYDKDGASWTLPGTLSGKKMRERLTIAPGTLRYKKAVEIAEADGGYREAAAAFGKCEAIPPGMPQPK